MKPYVRKWLNNHFQQNKQNKQNKQTKTNKKEYEDSMNSTIVYAFATRALRTAFFLGTTPTAALT
jgi:hypothetical protein